MPRLRRFPNACLFLLSWFLLIATPLAPARADDKADSGDLTFFVVSDTHYGLTEVGDETVPLLVDKMNRLPGTGYPASLGGGTVGVPRGVLHIGDVTDNGKEKPWKMFVRDYGLTGKEGRLAFPVYETFGNHDGGPKSLIRAAIRARNPGRVGLKDISENGLFYSWDWNGIHFVSLGVSPGPTARPYDPEHSIDFAIEDLRKNVGSSGRPVILLHHFGFDKSHSLHWWPEEWRTRYHEVIKDYNIIAILHGHAHKSSIYQWNGIDIYHPPHFRHTGPKNTGEVTHGFFVFHISGDELTVAERTLDDCWGMTAKKSFKSAAPTGAK